MKLLLYVMLFWTNSNGQDTASPDPRNQQNLAHVGKSQRDTQLNQFRKCLSNAKYLLFDQSSDEYKTLNWKINLAFEKAYPIAIFTPNSPSDVQTAVKCGVMYDIPLVPISGGHSYAGLSYGTNDSILIDFRNMKDIRLSDDKTNVTVESGALLGNLYYTLMREGLTVPVGSCLVVGMGGFILGGGIGHLSNKFGLAIDNLLELNMTDASGNALVVNEQNHTDLWWAMRGVGPGYLGLVTSVKMKVLKLDEFDFQHMKIRFRTDNFKNVMEAYVKWLDWVNKQCDDDDKRLNSVITIRRDDETDSTTEDPSLDRRGIVLDIIKIRKSRIGDRNGKEHFLTVALGFFVADCHSFQFDHPNFNELLARISYSPIATYLERLNITYGIDMFSTFTREDSTQIYHRTKSFMVNDTAHLTANLEKVQKILSKMPKSSFILIAADKGQIGEIPSNATAYVHRDSLFTIEMKVISDNTSNSDDFKAKEDWLLELFESLKFLGSGETFQNFPDLDLLEENVYLRRYYGTHLEKIIEIKNKWDPHFYFNSTMSLPIG